MNGQKLRDIRKASGMTLRQISIASDVTESQIIQIEKGYTKSPRINTLVALAKALGCSLVDFLDEE